MVSRFRSTWFSFVCDSLLVLFVYRSLCVSVDPGLIIVNLLVFTTVLVCLHLPARTELHRWDAVFAAVAAADAAAAAAAAASRFTSEASRTAVTSYMLVSFSSVSSKTIETIWEHMRPNGQCAVFAGCRTLDSSLSESERAFLHASGKQTTDT